MDDLKKERQVDNLVNLVKNYTRTDKHLEQYFEKSDIKNKNIANIKQELRKSEISKLKEQLVNNKKIKDLDEEIGDIVENYVSTENYILNNVEKMSGEMIWK